MDFAIENFMNPIDFVVVVILVVGFIWGFSKGFIFMIFSLLAILGGVFAAAKLSPLALPVIFGEQSQQVGYIVLFIVIFTFVYFIIKKLTYLFENMIEFLELEWLDSLLGGVVGLAQFVIIIGIVLTMIYNTGFINLIPGSEEVRIAAFVSQSSQSFINFIAGNMDKMKAIGGIEFSEAL